MKYFSDIKTEELAELEKLAHEMFSALFPIGRSLTGKGVTDSYKLLKKTANFNLIKISSGTKCFGWRVPNEWHIKEAFVENKNGKRLIDFKNNNLHVLGYSAPIDKVIPFNKLKFHLHTINNMPDAIPHRTTYYKKNWGFCLAYNDFLKFKKNEKYRVKIDSKFTPGNMLIGDYIKQGSTARQYLISTYSCHPSLANDNVSGMVLWSLLMKLMQKYKTLNTYRFLIGPETIGAIAFLHKNKRDAKKIAGGFVITCVAGPGEFGLKSSFQKNSEVDLAAKEAFRKLKIDFINYPFDLSGSDERHFSAPAFRIPTITITKNKYYEYDYYHTSLDNLKFVSARNLIKTLKIYVETIQKLEEEIPNIRYRSKYTNCEPRLGNKGLYPNIGGAQKTKSEKKKKTATSDLETIKWLFFYGNGKHSLRQISEITGIPLPIIYKNFLKLQSKSLIKKV